MGNRLTLT